MKYLIEHIYLHDVHIKAVSCALGEYEVHYSYSAFHFSRFPQFYW